MTKQEFEYHINQIIIDAQRIGRYAECTEIVESHQSSMQFHVDKLNEFYDRNEETE